MSNVYGSIPDKKAFTKESIYCEYNIYGTFFLLQYGIKNMLLYTRQTRDSLLNQNVDAFNFILIYYKVPIIVKNFSPRGTAGTLSGLIFQ